MSSPGPSAEPAGGARTNPLHERSAALASIGPCAKGTIEELQPIGVRDLMVMLVQGATNERSERLAGPFGLIA